MAVIRTKPLGDELLEALKQGPSRDCYVLKCVDSEERMIHRTVLILSSTYFANRIQDNPTQLSEDVPFTSEVIDAVMKFLYSHNSTIVDAKNAIKLYSAANMFNLEDLSRQLRKCFQYNLERFLEDENFFVNVSLDEMKLMENVFESCTLGTSGQILLVTHILRWGEATGVGSEYVVALLSALTKSVKIAKKPLKRRAC